MKKEFVTYDIAKKLKKLGCNVKSTFGMETALYTTKGELIFYANYGVMGSGLDENYIPAILWQQAEDWLAKQNVLVYPDHSNGYWIGVVEYAKGYYETDETNKYRSRELSVLKAIEICKNTL